MTPTTAESGLLQLIYLEVVSDSEEAVTFCAYDLDGLCVIPKTEIKAHGILTYNANSGCPARGLSWSASAPGLVGWYAWQGV